jgi:hypothetical protein
MADSTNSNELENFKILKSIWKNTYDKILEIKITNRRNLIESKKTILDEEKKKIDSKFDKLYNEEYISNKMYILNNLIVRSRKPVTSQT